MFSVQSDGVRFLFDNMARIGADDYVPTNQDILYSRKATKTITEYCVTINKIPFRFVDVGGQRSQRQKWFQCFECVTSILFIVSSSEYDQVLLEDRTKNRLRESQNIFETIVNNRCFTEVSYILFLNKTDLLEEKLKLVKALAKANNCVADGKGPVMDGQRPVLDRQVVSDSPPVPVVITSADPSPEDSPTSQLYYTVRAISDYFPEFMGDPTELGAVQAFIIGLFDAVRRDKRKQMYHHFTTAVDTENIKYVFNAVRNTILQNNITQLMLQ